MKFILRLRFLATLALALSAAYPLQAQAAPALKPTLANVPYGPHPRQVLDFYQAKSDAPAPLLFYVHGGAWMTGDKSTPDFLESCVKSGISVVSIDYRLIPDAVAAKVTPPVKACLEDAARALQFTRSRAGEWKIDKQRIACCGGSAGGFTCLWLAFHADMAEAKNADPVARESTRVRSALAFVPQTSLDPKLMKEWIPNVNYGQQAFSIVNYQEFLDRREELMPWIRENSPYALATATCPPVYLFYNSVPAVGQPYSDPPHSANFGAPLAEKLESLGVECEFNYPGAPALKHPDMFGFLCEKLGVAAGK